MNYWVSFIGPIEPPSPRIAIFELLYCDRPLSLMKINDQIKPKWRWLFRNINCTGSRSRLKSAIVWSLFFKVFRIMSFKLSGSRQLRWWWDWQWHWPPMRKETQMVNRKRPVQLRFGSLGQTYFLCSQLCCWPWHSLSCLTSKLERWWSWQSCLSIVHVCLSRVYLAFHGLSTAIQGHSQPSRESMPASDGVRCKAEVIQLLSADGAASCRARETDREETTGHYNAALHNTPA